jgi:predicted NACHT family NTPase
VSGFKGQAYIESLARNPLMLSAICLVNYFEGGRLPKDRAVLYRLCVGGLLHNWDQRRGILSEFTFEEKLRVTREVALEMQVNDRAEYELAKVQAVFAAVLKNEERAATLLEHIRYRTGLLLERRPAVFAFAHLTFQEYLAARAIHEGNRSGIGIEQLIREYDDPRWQEVIALYCGISPAPVAIAKQVIEALAAHSNVSGALIGEAYFSSGPELAEDNELRHKVMWSLARSQSSQEVPSSPKEFYLKGNSEERILEL